LAINPAYAGSLQQAQVNGLFRKQWNNVPGAPQTSTLNFHNSIKEKHMGYGIAFLNDQIGKIQTNGVMGIYSYTLEFEKSKLAFGAQVGVRNFSAKLTESNLSLDNSYDAAFANNVSQWSVNFGTGALWYTEKWFVGLSIPHLRNNLLNKDNVTNVSDEARLRTHYYLNGGYLFNLSEDFDLSHLFHRQSSIRM
jgi:type IX secretion system PorP/SprF family membrane protein